MYKSSLRHIHGPVLLTLKVEVSSLRPNISSFLVPVPSAPPKDVICTPVSAHDLQVTWNPPDQAYIHGIVQGYKLFYEPVEERYGG